MRFGISIDFEPADGEAGLVDVGATRIRLADHPSSDRALMFGIVREVIRRLEHPHPHLAATEPLRPLP